MFISTILDTNSINNVDLPLSNKQTVRVFCGIQYAERNVENAVIKCRMLKFTKLIKLKHKCSLGYGQS